MTSEDAHESVTKIFASPDPQEFWLPVARARFLDENNRDVDAIDRDLEALATVLRLGRERRNRMTVAARLPAEILATIFEFVKQETYGEYEDTGDKEREGNVTPEDEPKVKIMGWNTFSYVCRKWRQVALDFPYIWREIKFSHCGPNWAYEMVRRSKATPLHVEIGSGHHANPYFRKRDVEKFADDLLTNHAGRLRTFTIFGEDILPLTQQLISRPELPILKFLHIENTDSTAIPTLSLPLIAERMPSLRELCAIGVMLLGVPSITLDNLTYFDLQMPETPGIEPLYGWMLLDVFKCMPVLQHLYITDVYPGGEPPKGLQPLDLPAPLETLTLAARLYSRELLSFSRMLAHPTAFRDFEFQSPVEPELLNALFSRDVGTERPPRSLYLEMDYTNDKIVFSASFKPWAISADGNTPTPLNDISVTVQDVDMHAARFLEGICLHEIVDMTFLDDSDSAAARWHELGQALNVRHLRVIGRACRPLFRLLGAHDDLFPSVDSLSVIETELTPQLGKNELEGADELLAALEVRRLRNTPIRDLKVPDRLVNGTWTAPLRAIVDKFGGSRPRFY